MYATVHTFGHLHAAEEQRLTQELEYRRIALERGVAIESSAVRFAHRIAQRLHRPVDRKSPRLSPSR